jgi:hypothetical protein
VLRRWDFFCPPTKPPKIRGSCSRVVKETLQAVGCVSPVFNQLALAGSEAGPIGSAVSFKKWAKPETAACVALLRMTLKNLLSHFENFVDFFSFL